MTAARRALLAVALACCVVAAGAAPLRQLEKSWPHTDFSRRTVALDEIESGGVPKDGIPAIDAPAFESITSAQRWLDPQEPVIAVTLGEASRAYPIQILIWHEIVNDELDGHPIAVTFCPLCNASLVFDRRVDGQVLSFGTTGMLRMSDLVMYDRQTGSWWQQFTGEGIVGVHAGTMLTPIHSQIVPFGLFADGFPHAEVLSRPRGGGRPYGRNPYQGYDSVNSSPFAFRDRTDPRLRPMERVLGVRIGTDTVVYPLSKLRDEPVKNDTVGGKPIVVLATEQMRSPLDRSRIADSRTIPAAAAFSRDINGQSHDFVVRDGVLVDEQTGSKWDLFGRAVTGPLAGQQLRPVDGGVHFAFAWLAFNPETRIR
ncbi:MAG: DUF3179 domain-containing protein [Steroidobacteraceae bacterium]